MSARPSEIQDSIKIALDAADAATDVTAEFGKIKAQNKLLESNVQKIHRSITIIFFSAMIGMVVSAIFAGLIYFRTMSDMKTMSTTSREALVVFAENVNQVNKTLVSLEKALKTQESLVQQNGQLITDLQKLNESITMTRTDVVASLKSTSDKIASSNKTLSTAVAKGLSIELTNQQNKISTQVKSIEKKTLDSISKIANSMDDDRQLKAIYARQGEMLKALEIMTKQNMTIVKQIEDSTSSIKYP
jgi:septal ring factor EnvC (AmiA/AmiB activator)